MMACPRTRVRSLLVSEDDAVDRHVQRPGELRPGFTRTFGEPAARVRRPGDFDVFRAPDGAIWAYARPRATTTRFLLGRYDGAESTLWEKGDAPLPDSWDKAWLAIGADAQRRVRVAVLSGGVHIWEGGAQQEWSEAGDPPSGLICTIVP